MSEDAPDLGLLNVALLGNSGSGKSGALASLVKAGYNLFIADYDKGLEILKNVLKTEAVKDKVPPQTYLSRVDYETCRDPSTMAGNIPIPSDSKAWAKGIAYLEKAAKSATENDILVMDSASFAAKSALIYTLKINNRLAQRPWESDWGDAQRIVERMIDLLTANGKAHVIATFHIDYRGDKEAGIPEKGFPATVGKALNTVIGRYFNHQLLLTQVGTGANIARRLHTTTFQNIELKNTNPGVVKLDYPIATGLADYFRDVRGKAPAGGSRSPAPATPTTASEKAS
jgi:hypothetical protein